MNFAPFVLAMSTDSIIKIIMQSFFQNWTITRAFHFVSSIVVLYLAFAFNNNVFLYILGFGFLIQSMLNVGCSSGQCQRPTHFKYKRRGINTQTFIDIKQFDWYLIVDTIMQ